MNVFYARVSLESSDLENQLFALRSKWGDLPVHTDSISAVKKRPSLDHLLNTLPAGSTIYAVAQDRLSREMSDAFSIMKRADDRKINLITIKEGNLLELNKLLFAIHAYVAEEERKNISRRTKAGIEQQRKKYGGRWGGQLAVKAGRKPSFGPDRYEIAKPFIEELRLKGVNYDQIAALATQEFGTFYSKTRVYGMLNPERMA